MIEQRCVICGQPCIDHGLRALIWRSPYRYVRRARILHRLLAQL